MVQDRLQAHVVLGIERRGLQAQLAFSAGKRKWVTAETGVEVRLQIASLNATNILVHPKSQHGDSKWLGRVANGAGPGSPSRRFHAAPQLAN